MTFQRAAIRPWVGAFTVPCRSNKETRARYTVNGSPPLRSRMVTAIAEEFIELIDDVTGKVVRCRKFVAPPVNPEWPLYFTNAAREREQRADATLPIVDWPGIRAPFF